MVLKVDMPMAVIEITMVMKFFGCPGIKISEK
jgi:hypothetical protein